MGLQDRINNFDILSSRFKTDRPTDLIISHKIEDSLFKKFQMATCLYVSKSIGENCFIEEENKLIQELDKHYESISNITPNGIIVPKKHSIIEYNLLVSSFMSIINSLNINDLISSWHVPLNLRCKQGHVNENNMKRHHPTEHIHSDSWAGESSKSITMMLPIFGDTEKNNVCFYHPPDTFEEEWLGPLPTYVAGKEIAEKYSKIDFVAPKGNLIFSDFSTLHSSSRLKNAGTRLSIDTTFVLKQKNSKEKIHEWRQEERAIPDKLSNLGSDTFLYFPDDNETWVDSQGGFKHPSNLQIMDLKKLL